MEQVTRMFLLKTFYKCPQVLDGMRIMLIQNLTLTGLEEQWPEDPLLENLQKL